MSGSERFISWIPSGRELRAAALSAVFFPFAVGVLVGVMITLMTVGIAAETVFSAERQRGGCEARCDERGFKTYGIDDTGVCWCTTPKARTKPLPPLR